MHRAREGDDDDNTELHEMAATHDTAPVDEEMPFPIHAHYFTHLPGRQASSKVARRPKQALWMTTALC